MTISVMIYPKLKYSLGGQKQAEIPQGYAPPRLKSDPHPYASLLLVAIYLVMGNLVLVVHQIDPNVLL